MAKPKSDKKKQSKFGPNMEQRMEDKEESNKKHGDEPEDEPKDEPKDELSGQKVLELPINDILDNPNQPRKRFDEESLRELAESIEANELLNPVLVRKGEDGYYLVAGERRLRACKSLGRDTIKAIEVGGDPEIASLVDNIQREDLHPYERGLAIKKLCAKHGNDKTRVAQVISKSKRTVDRLLRIGELQDKVDGSSDEEKTRKLVENNIPLREFYKLLRYDDSTEFNVKLQQLDRQYSREPSTEPIQRRAKKTLDEIDKTLAFADKIKQELEKLSTDKDDKRLDELMKKILEIRQIIDNLKLA